MRRPWWRWRALAPSGEWERRIGRLIDCDGPLVARRSSLSGPRVLGCARGKQSGPTWYTLCHSMAVRTRSRVERYGGVTGVMYRLLPSYCVQATCTLSVIKVWCIPTRRLSLRHRRLGSCRLTNEIAARSILRPIVTTFFCQTDSLILWSPADNQRIVHNVIMMDKQMVMQMLHPPWLLCQSVCQS